MSNRNEGTQELAEPARLSRWNTLQSVMRRQLPSREAKCGTKMGSIILCAPYGGMRNEPLSTTNS